VIIALINAFIYYNDEPFGLDSTGNTVISPVTEAGFRRALQYLSGLRRDGLLEPTLFTVDQNGFRALLNANPAVVGFTSAGSQGHWTDAPNNPNFIAMDPMIAPLSSPGFPGYTPQVQQNGSTTIFITNKAKNVDLAVKVMDSFYESDLSLIMQYGEEGVDWTRDPAILANLSNAYTHIGITPAVTYATTWDSWAVPSNRHWGGAGPRYFPVEMTTSRGLAYAPFDPARPTAMLSAINYQEYLPRRPEYILPTLNYTLEEATALARTLADVNAYVRRSIAEFVIGARDIDSDSVWNAYIRELDTMGLPQLVSAAQAAYNRQR
jgi:putative aldouronate transport system substrate-binding protein